MQGTNTETPTFKLLLDGTVLRHAKHARTIYSDWHKWNMNGSSNSFVLPSIGIGMLLPKQLSNYWLQSGSSVDRLKLNDWNVPNAGFMEWPLRHADDTYIDGLCDGIVVSTKSDYPTNQAWFVSMFVNSTGNDTRCAMILAYNGLSGSWPSIIAADIAIGIYTDGTCKVWQGANEIGGGSIAAKTESVATGASGGIQQGTGASKSIANTYLDLMIIPQGRSLIITSSLGGVCVVGIPGTADDDPTPVLTAGGTFVWYAPTLADGSYQRVTAQICPLKYAASGNLVSIPQFVGDLADTPTWLRAISGRTRAADGTTVTPSVAIDSNTATINIGMAGDGNVTPFVYGAVATWAYNGNYEASNPIEINTQSSSYEDGLRADDGQMSFVNMISAPLGDADSWKLSNTAGRSWRLDVGSVCWIAGVISEAPEASADYGNTCLHWRGVDAWGLVKMVRLKDAIPLDGMLLSDAILMLLNCAGIQSSVCDVPTLDYTIPIGDKGEWLVMAEAGASIGETIDKLHDTYAKDHLYGFRPGVFITGEPIPQYAFWWRTPDTLDTDVKAEVNLRDKPGCVIATGFRQTVKPPVANEIWVTGFDHAMNKRIQAYWINADSQDINGIKTPEWLGQPVIAGVVDDSWKSQSEVNRICEILAKAWGSAHVIVEIKTLTPITYQYLSGDTGVSYKIPVWVGDLIKITGTDTDPGITARVRTVSYIPQITDDALVVECSYTAELNEVLQ